jgi:hypothetical protein
MWRLADKFAHHGAFNRDSSLEEKEDGSCRCRAIASGTLSGQTVRLHVGGRDETDLVAQLADLAAPQMSAAAGFHGDNARGQIAEERQHLIPPQLLAQDCPTRPVSPMQLKHILRQVEPDRDNLRHDRSPLWILADPPWHTDAVGGRSHHQRPVQKPSEMDRRNGVSDTVANFDFCSIRGTQALD